MLHRHYQAASCYVDLTEIFSQILCIMSLVCLCLYSIYSPFPGHDIAELKYQLTPLIWAILLLYASNILYCCLNLHERLLLMYLHAGMFLFWLSRIVFAPFLDWGCWFLESYDSTLFALTSIYITLLCSRAGAVFYSWRQCNQQKNSFSPRGILQQENMLSCLRLAAFILFMLAFLAECYKGIIMLKMMSGLDYEDYYLIDWGSVTPWAVGIFSSMLPYFFAAYLASFPRKKMTVLALIAYLITTLPMLKIGSRSFFVMIFIFAAFYYVTRAIIARQRQLDEVWITKRLVIASLCLLPFGVLAMGAMNYLRDGQKVTIDMITLLADAFYKQGVSFDVLGHGFTVSDKVSELGFRFFTLGGVIDDVSRSFVGEYLLGTQALPDYNSVELALQGHSYAHTMSYFAHPYYLLGEGYGSTYTLELYQDFGYLGIALGSGLIAYILCLMSQNIGKSWFGGLLALIVALNVIHMPRGYVNELFYYVFDNKFWLALGALFIGALLLRFVGHASITMKGHHD